MWTCPRCQARMQPDFEVCWRCGTTRQGDEDPDFVTADDSPPIAEPTDFLRLDVGKLPIDGDLPEPPLDLVACPLSVSGFEAKLLVDELAAEGIPSTLEDMTLGKNSPMGFPCRIMIRSADSPRAMPLIEGFRARRRDH